MEKEFPRDIDELSPEERVLFEQLLLEEGVELAEAETIPPRQDPDDRPLSFAQQRLWFLDRLLPESPAYNVPSATRLFGRLDRPALADALGEVARRHETLRTTFHEVGGEPLQVVAPPAAFPLPLVDLTALPAACRAREAGEQVREEARRPFDLARGPLLRALLLRTAAEEHTLLLTMHHIVSDGWSMGVLVRELGALYAACSLGLPSPLPPLRLQYADFAVWQRERLAGERLEQDLAWWLDRLRGAPAALDLHGDRSRPAVPTGRGDRYPFELPAEVLSCLHVLGRQQRASLFMILLSGFGLLLHRYTGQDDLVIGSPIANRNRPEIEGLIGFFVNTLALRVDLAGNPDFLTLLERVREVTLGAYAHQDLPFERLVEELQPERSLSWAPLFQVMLVLQNAPAEAVETPGVRLIPVDSDPGVVKFDLLLSAVERGDALVGLWELSRDLFDVPTVGRMTEHLVQLLTEVALDPGRRLLELPLLGGAERAQVTAEWNDTGRPLPPDTLTDLFRAQAERTPDRVALWFGDAALTYDELGRRAARLARTLRRLGVAPDVPVGICLERSAEMAVSVLGVLEAGGACVPLDPAYPRERQSFLLADTAAPVIVTEETLATALDAALSPGVRLLRLDAEADAIAREADAPPPVLHGPGHLFYVIYTSGSTGRPKGIELSHAALSNLLEWHFASGLLGGARTLQYASLGFDASFHEMFAAWISGGTLFMVPEEMRRDLPALSGLLAGHGIEKVILPVVVLHRLAELCQAGATLPESLREITTTGEQLQVTSAMAQLFASLPGRPLHNHYGPSESHVVTALTLTGDPAAWPYQPSIGRPIHNSRILVLDSEMHPVPAGVPGELLIGGVCLARGYLRRPALTAEKFVPDPYGETGDRLYRTGDLARWLPDGNLQFLGRIDHQLKIRGFRVEPGEVEARLDEHPAVKVAAVVARHDFGEPRLVAYVAADPGAVTAAELRAFLRDRLPDSMVPSSFVLLPSLPLTTNGKIDRRALPAPDTAEEAGDGERFQLPASQVEELIAGLFADLLHVERVGAGSSFFELGGHSLLATRLVSRIGRAFGVELPVRAVFETPTPAGLAGRVEKGLRGAGLPPIEPIPRNGVLPVSFAQQRLWFLEHLTPGGSAYHLPAVVRLMGRLDRETLAASLFEVVRRHEVLRTTFPAVDGEPVQVVSPPAVFLPGIDLSALPETVRAAEIRRLGSDEAARPFDLDRGPLLRTELVGVGNEEHVLLLNMHHIVSDGWSMGVMVRELVALYRAFSQGLPSPLPEPRLQYADFAAWQRRWLAGEVLDAELAHWRQRMEGLPPALELPPDRPRPAVQSYRGRSVTFSLGADVAARARELARRQGATVYMTLLAAFQALLGRYTGQEDVAVGSPVAGRSHLQTEELIGLFVNTLLLRTDLSGDPGFAELLSRVREVTLDAWAHQDLPFERLVSELQPQRDLMRNPLFQVMIVLQNLPSEAVTVPGLRFGGVEIESRAAKLDLIIAAHEHAGGLDFVAEYNRDLFDATTIHRFLRHLAHLLAAGLADPAVPVALLDLLAEEERQALLGEWNDTADAGVPLPVPMLFQRRAEETPGALAVVCGDERLTFEELQARSARLARRLRRLGVGAESRVGLCVERRPHLLVGILGILQAGAAYVPLDPKLPAERLAFILEDALGGLESPVLLTQEDLAGRVPATGLAGLRVLLLEEDVDAEEELPLAIAPESLAYVLYTSGSTGRPKGVAVPHGGLASYLSWCVEAYEVAAGAGAPVHSSIGFDLTVTSLLAPLVAGRPAVLLPEEDAVPALADALRRQEGFGGFSLVKITPAHLRVLAQLFTPEEPPRGVRTLVVGGEALLAEDLAFWRQASPATVIVNEYGPTETVVGCVVYRVTAEDPDALEQGPVPIGRPIANTRLRLLDRRLQPVSAGAAGELYIGGAGVARGYLGRPDLTAERFLPDPFGAPGGEPGARVYRTGDLARFLGDGTLQFLGRADDQVKLRGYRIEPGEIEAALGSHGGVREAVVVLRQEGGTAQLVAYLVPSAGRPAAPAADDLRAFLLERLPDYMVPTAFVCLEALPLTPNGKVNRLALSRLAPVAEPAAGAAADGGAPRNPLEEILAAVWREVLGVDKVGIHDNFFELGGDSILSLQVTSRIRKRGWKVTSRQMFTSPTIAELAAVAQPIQPAAGEAPAPAPAVSAVPLTPVQRWFFEQGLPHPEHFNQSLLLELRPLASGGRIQAPLLERALAPILALHDTLRSRFEPPAPGQTEWRQIVEPGPVSVPLLQIDLTSLPADQRRPALEREAARLQASLDLRRAPLLRVALFTLGDGAADRLLLVAHHLITDGVSWRILLEDLESACRQLARGANVANIELPPRTTSFQRWAESLVEHARSAPLQAQAGAWLEIGRRPLAPLPMDDDGPDDVAAAASLGAALDADETRALLQEVPRAYRTQINDVLLTALAQAFAGWTGGRRLLVDLEGHGREEIADGVDTSRTVGWFTSIFPVLVDVEGTAGAGEALKRVKERLRSLPDRGLGHGVLRYLDAGETGERLRRLPRAEVLFNYLGQLDQVITAQGLFGPAAESAGPLRHGGQRRSHALEINCSVQGGRLFTGWTYGARRLRRGTVERLSRAFLAALREIMAHCADLVRRGEESFTPSDFPLVRLDQETLDRLAAAAPVGASGTIEDLYPASPMQEGMLFHSLHAPGSGVYIEQLGLHLDEDLDVAAFEQAWEALTRRHAILRTAFAWLGVPAPLQVVYRQAPLVWDRRDWRGLPPAEWRRRLIEHFEADRRQGFDLAVPPLFRLALFRIDGGYRFVWSHHHVLLDGWSMPILLHELFALYRAACRGEVAELPPAPLWRSYIAWLAEQDAAAAEAFWRRTLAGFTEPTPLAPLGGRAVEEGSAGHGARVVPLTEETTERLRDFARRHRMTLNNVVQAAWGLLLHRWSGEPDVVFGAVLAGRSAPLPDIEGMVGLFINTLPVRVRVRPETGLLAWLEELHEGQAEMRNFEHTPLSQVQAWSDVARGRPLFESILVFENYPVDEAVQEEAGRGLGISEADFAGQTNYPLTLLAAPGAILGFRLAYDAARFDATFATRLLEHLVALLEAFPDAAGQTLASLPSLLAHERQQVLYEWNDTARRSVDGACLHELFLEQAQRDPEAVALLFGEREVSYGALARLAGRLAWRLWSAGARPESRVAICIDRSPEMVAAVLGTLAAGAAYVPLDPELPPSRLSLLLADSAAEVLVTRQSLRARLPQLAGRVICVDDAEEVPEPAFPFPPAEVTPANLAYVVYTSGSTGRPKGVLSTHDGAVSYLRFLREAYGLSAGDRVLQLPSLVFDSSVRDILGPLAAGAAVVLVTAAEARDPRALLDAVDRHGVNAVLSVVPTLLRGLLDTAREADRPAGGLRLLLTSGERLDHADCVRAREVFGDAVEIFNQYGPTESTMTSSFHRAWRAEGRDGGGDVPIGRPIPDNRFLLLGPALAPVPPGAVGDLYIAGRGLARGYLDRPDLTAERFLPDPFSPRPGGRLYTTGDRARHRPDGALEFLGRRDVQVKVQGIRVEPGEVEEALRQHPAVRDAAVLAWSEPPPARLVAYLDVEGAAPPAEALRRFLRQTLPDAMVPSLFVALVALPRMLNGKVDRQELAKRGLPEAAADAVAPRDAAEELMAGIWSELLGVERLGIHDDFFALGGHSLLATRVVSRVRGVFGVELPLRSLFDNPTVALLAAAVTAARRAGGGERLPAIEPVRRDGPLALSFAQQRLWFLDRLAPGSPTYNIPSAFALQGRLDVPALAWALAEVVRRHEPLRTTFAEMDGVPVQVIAPPTPQPLPVVALGALPADARELESLRLADREAVRPFDLQRGPLLRMTLLRRGAEDSVVLLTVHHIVSDGWSSGILLREIPALYDARIAGVPAPLPELPLQYADFAVWQRRWLERQEAAAAFAYWQEHLRGLPPALELPTDRPRPPVQTFRGASRPVHFAADLTAGLQRLCRRLGATPFMVLLAAFQALLGRYTTKTDIAVGSPVAGRSRVEVENLVGLFVNTLVLRIDLAGEPGFAELVSRARRVTLDAHAHQDVPFEKLVEELAPERSLSHSPLFQVAFAFQEAPEAPAGLFGAAGRALGVRRGTAKFDLSLSVLAAPSFLAGVLEYNTDLFDGPTAGRMVGHLTELLAGGLADPDRRLSLLPLLTAEERGQILREWCDTGKECPQLPMVHELFALHARRQPGAPAVASRDAVLTYGELEARANRLAWHLRGLGVGPDVLVALCTERTLDRVAGIVAVLKAGGAYVSLDPTYPKERLAFMLDDARAPVLLTQRKFVELLPETTATILCLDDPEDGPAEDPGVPESGVGPDNLSYVVYTSGSTGRPKGVEIPHTGLMNLVRWHQDLYGVRPGDRGTQIASPAFDASIWELWPYLAGGASVHIPDEETRLSSPGMIRWWSEVGITLAYLMTPLAEGVLEEKIPPGLELRVRALIIGGDRLHRGPDPEVGFALMNHYGPAEYSVTCTVVQVPPLGQATGIPTIGRAIDNTLIYILDRAFQPVPVGVPGELYVAGIGLARGYLRRPDLTAEKFIPDPFSAEPGARMYRTADLVRWLPDGDIDFLGRLDHQVKIRGLRIELGEIESALGQHPALREVAVLVREDRPGQKRLVGYAVPVEPSGPPADELRAFLKERLPEYMVPATFLILDAFPLTPNGKVDRRALPAPAGALEADHVAPRNAIEEELAAIWREVLHLDRVGVHDVFFELGGHSLLATRVVARVRQHFGVEVPLRDLFQAPTIAGLAEVVLAGSTTGEDLPLSPSPLRGTTDRFPCSFGQRRLWFLDQLWPGTPLYNIASTAHLPAGTEPAVLERALGEVVRRHEALRTRFDVEQGEPVQVVTPAAPWPLPRIDLRALPAPVLAAEARRLAREEARRPFDLARGPLLRTALLTVPDEHVLLLTLHHIVSDGLSQEVLVRELRELYAAFATGRPSPLPELPLQYADFAHWQRRRWQGEALERQLAFWAGRLRELPVLDLPTDKPRPATLSPAGAAHGFDLAAELANVQSLCRGQGATFFMVLFAAFSALLHRYSGQDDFALGTPVAGRDRVELEGLVGFFVNTLVLRVDLTRDPSVAELLAQVREAVLAAHAHQDLPFERLVEELQPERTLGQSPLFQAMLVTQAAAPGTRSASPLDLGDFSRGLVKFDLTLVATELEDGLWCEWRYRRDLFTAATMERAAGHLANLLRAAAADPERRLSDLPLLSEAERRQLLGVGEDRTDPTDRSDPSDLALSLPQLLARQAERRPDAVAVAQGEELLTYAALHRRSARLAARLRELGVGPEALVALCLERSPEWLAAAFAVLAAGGAYLPLDPAWPAERLRFLLADSAARLLITRRDLAAGSALREVPGVLALDLAEIGDGQDGPVPAPADPEHLAYVIYTSGSTGRPKGVRVPHRGLGNLAFEHARALRVGPDSRVLQLASPGFDASVAEIASALPAGATLCLPPAGTPAAGPGLAALLAREQITVATLPPSVLASLPEAEALPALQALIVAGEACPLDLADRWGAGRLLVNGYGPTEATVCATLGVHSPGRGYLSLGRPPANVRVQLFDRRLSLAPLGIPGELCVAGIGLARGYLGRPDLTAERFVPDPFAGEWGEPGARLYRTGDLARRLPEGDLEYLGRIDHQVNVRGFRVELGEIEAAVARHPAVREAAVLARRPTGDPGDVRLLAYAVLRSGAEPPTAADLRAFLSATLPDAMLPADLMVLPALPLLPSGKVDRKSLERLAAERAAQGRESGPEAAPRTALERDLAALWRELLHAEVIGRDDDFFALGGNSITGATLVNRLQERLGEIVHVVVMFEAPTIARLAAWLAREYPQAVARLWGLEACEAAAPAEEAAIDADRFEELRRLLPFRPQAPAIARAKNRRAIFVLSPPRSGSTLLRVVLGGHPELFAPPELELLTFLTLGERREYFPERDRFWLEGTVRAVMEIRGCSAEEAEALIAEAEREGETTADFYARLQEWIGGRMLVDKTPSYALSLDVLRRAEEWFDETLYIHLVRHPLGMVNSFEEARLEQVFFQSQYPFARRELAELVWLVSQQNIVRFLEEVPETRQVRVHFEDLVRQPEATIERLCGFLGLAPHPEMMRPYGDTRGRMTDGIHPWSRMLGDVKFHQHSGIEETAADRWRERLAEASLSRPARSLAAALGCFGAAQPRLAWTPIEPAARGPETPVPLSFAQQRLWFLDLLEPGNPAYNIPVVVGLEGALDPGALAAALTEVARRHEVLRTTFGVVDGEPVQRVGPAAPVPVPRVDLSALPEPRRRDEARRLCLETARRPFDLARGPLFRTALLRLGAEEHIAVFILHHITGDAWSMGILVRELGALYRAGRDGQPAPLPELRVQYADFALWQRRRLSGDLLQAELGYWRERLRGIDEEPLDLPADRPRPPVPTFRGARVSSHLPATALDGLRALSQRHGATLFMTLLAAFDTFLCRFTGQERIAVGTPVSGRNHRHVEELIGFFVNTLVLRADLAGDPSFAALLDRVRDGVLGDYAHQDLPFEKLVEELRPDRDLRRTPLFQVMLVLQNVPPVAPDTGGLVMRPLGLESGTAQFDLILSCVERPDGLFLNLDYKTDLFAPATAAGMARLLANLLQGIARDPSVPLGDLPLLDEMERREVLCRWNPPPQEPAEAEGLHRLVERWAAVQPDAVALISDGAEGQSLTYGAFVDRAGRLAAELRSLGVGTESRVGIWARRSFESVIALFAVLQAGGAYVPLDPDQPRERLAVLLADAGLGLVVAAEDPGPPVSGSVPVLRLDQERAAAPPEPLPPPAADLANAAAYVIYTSGSTGTPKGVVLQHGSAVRFVRAFSALAEIAPDDRMLLFVPLTFDASIEEAFGMLASGGSLLLHPDPRRLSIGEITELCERHSVTLLELPTALLGQWIEDRASRREPLPPPVRALLTGGESLPVARLRAWGSLPGRRSYLLSSYGPTEATVTSTTFKVESGELPDLPGINTPIGRPLPHVRAYVLDRQLRPLPRGVAGELFVAGGLARGYLGAPSLTAAAFVPDPVSPAEGGTPGGRLYRTGDLARHLPDGDLEFLGRRDQQVKVRGYRIDLREIEAALAAHPAVRRGAVAVAGAYEDRRLAAWVELVDGAGDSDDIAADLRLFVAGRLPAYMVPAAVVCLDRLPTLASGKVDFKLLPAPVFARPEAREPLAARDPLEAELVRIWEEVLGTSPVGVQDDFFALGGHSLLAVRLVARIQERFGRSLPMSHLFQNGTIEALAGTLRGERETRPASPLVALRATGHLPPFFCVHPAGGSVLSYYALAQHLDPERPFYALQAWEGAAVDGPLETVEEMADVYLEAVVERFPEGPYHLGGWSFGALVAFEMAQRLLRRGREVASVVLMDTPAPGVLPAGADDAAASLAFLASEAGLQVDAEELRRLDPESLVAHLAELTAAAGLLERESAAELVRRRLAMHKASMGAVQQYAPRPYPGRLTIVRASEMLKPRTADRPALDLDYGWRRYAAGPVEIHVVPGTHQTMMQEPHVHDLARTLSETLRAALTRPVNFSTP